MPKTAQYDIDIDGAKYRVTVPSTYTDQQVQDLGQQISQSKEHQSYLTNKMNQDAGHNLFLNLQQQRYQKELGVSPDVAHLAAVDSQYMGADKVQQAAELRQNTAQADAAWQDAKSSPAAALRFGLGLPFQVGDRAILGGITGQNPDELQGNGYWGKVAHLDGPDSTNPLAIGLSSIDNAAQTQGFSGFVTRIAEGLASPTGLATLGVSPLLRTLSASLPVADAVVDAANPVSAGLRGTEALNPLSTGLSLGQRVGAAANLADLGNIGYLGANAAATSPYLFSDPAKFAEANALPLLHGALGLAGKTGLFSDYGPPVDYTPDAGAALSEAPSEPMPPAAPAEAAPPPPPPAPAPVEAEAPPPSPDGEEPIDPLEQKSAELHFDSIQKGDVLQEPSGEPMTVLGKTKGGIKVQRDGQDAFKIGRKEFLDDWNLSRVEPTPSAPMPPIEAPPALPAEVPPEIKENQPEEAPPPPAPNEPLPVGDLSTASDLDKAGLFRQVLDRVRNFWYENLSGLSRQAPDTAAKATEFASANDIARIQTKQGVDKVIDSLSPEDAKRLQTYGVANRSAAFYDQAKADGVSPKELQQIAYQPEGGRLLDPVDQTPITEQKLAAYFAQPDVQTAHQAYSEHIAPLMKENFEGSGYEANGILGKYGLTGEADGKGAFFPAISLDENGQPLRGSSRGEYTGPKGRLAGVPGAKAFTGTADMYEPDLSLATYDRLAAGNRARSQRELIAQMLQDGVAVPVEEGSTAYGNTVLKGDDRGTFAMDYQGVKEPATRVDLGTRFGWKEAPEGLPAKIVVPNRFLNELNPLFDSLRSDHVNRLLSGAMGDVLQKYLIGPGDAAAHSYSLSSRLAKAIPWGKRGSITDVITSAIPEVKSVANVLNLTKWAHTDSERAQVLHFMAENGRLPRDFGEPKGVVGNILNGEKGVVVNAATTLFKYVDKMGPGGRGGVDTPQGQALLRDMMGELNTGIHSLQPTVQKMLGHLGLGSFYQTGIKNRTAAFRQPPAVLAASLLGGIVLKAALYQAFSPQHKSILSDPSAKLGDIPVGHNKDNTPRYFNINSFDRTGSYAEYLGKSIESSLARHDSFKQGAENAVADTANNFLSPLFSGPVAGAASATAALSPQIRPNDNLTGFDVVANSNKKSDYGSLDRAGHIAESLMPLSGALSEPFMSTDENRISDPGLRIGNAAMKLIGLQPVRGGQHPGRVLAADRRKEMANKRLK